MSQFFASGGQSTGVSASASVLPINTQDWLPLGWTGWISLRNETMMFSHRCLFHLARPLLWFPWNSLLCLEPLGGHTLCDTALRLPDSWADSLIVPAWVWDWFIREWETVHVRVRAFLRSFADCLFSALFSAKGCGLERQDHRIDLLAYGGKLPEILKVLCWLKKRYTTWELWVKFYLGQNEDCSPGGSISDSSERLFQSGSGGKSIYKVLVQGEFNTMKHSFYKRFFVSHEDLMSPWRDLTLL